MVLAMMHHAGLSSGRLAFVSIVAVYEPTAPLQPKPKPKPTHMPKALLFNP